MNIQIKHRFSGSTLFAGEFGSLRLAIEEAISVKTYLREADLSEADLRGAYLREADLRGADLREADLSEANLSEADLRGANLSEADLRGAYLREADLRGAYLRGANLSEADLGGADVIDAGQDRRGYRFVGWLSDGSVMVNAGCRNLSLADARVHWSRRHIDDPALQTECVAKLNLIEAVARARGWIQDA